MNEKKYKIVHSYIDADRIIKDGFQCYGIDRNPKNKRQLIFLFDYNNEVINKLNYYADHKLF